MCSIFGFNLKENLEELKNLGISGESRGTDATGISILNDGGFNIIKSPVRAKDFMWDQITTGGDFYQGHTRATTQGNEENNQNNHPFVSKKGDFTLTHNGVIYNDRQLKTGYALPKTNIETDTYVAVQLMEYFKYVDQADKLSIDHVKATCQELSGSFALSILTNDGRLFLLRNNNPLFVLFNGQDLIYASTLEMLESMYDRMKKGEVETMFHGIAGNIPEQVIYEIDLNNLKVLNKKKFKSSTYGSSKYGKSWYRYGNNKYTSNTKTKKNKKEKNDLEDIDNSDSKYLSDIYYNENRNKSSDQYTKKELEVFYEDEYSLLTEQNWWEELSLLAVDFNLSFEELRIMDRIRTEKIRKMNKKTNRLSMKI